MENKKKMSLPMLFGLLYVVSLFLPLMRARLNMGSVGAWNLLNVFQPTPPGVTLAWDYYYGFVAEVAFVLLAIASVALRKAARKWRILLALLALVSALILATPFVRDMLVNGAFSQIPHFFTENFGLGYYLSTLSSFAFVGWLFYDIHKTKGLKN